MKPGKSATRPAKQKPILEHEGDMLTTNHWIQIGLLRSQVKALTRLGKRWSTSKSPCASAARILISLGLLNEDETESKLLAVGDYMKAEGFHTLGMYCEGVMRAKERAAK
jgi:hypothetical protein